MTNAEIKEMQEAASRWKMRTDREKLLKKVLMEEVTKVTKPASQLEPPAPKVEVGQRAKVDPLENPLERKRARQAAYRERKREEIRARDRERKKK